MANFCSAQTEYRKHIGDSFHGQTRVDLHPNPYRLRPNGYIRPQRKIPQLKVECKAYLQEVQSLREQLKPSQAYADHRDRECAELKSKHNKERAYVDRLVRKLYELQDRINRRKPRSGVLEIEV